MTEEEVAANFSFLTVDELMDDSSSGQIRPQRKKTEFLDGQISKVFVWGLNDYHQLGGVIIDNKVHTYTRISVIFTHVTCISI